MNLIALGWTYSKTSCTETITYTIELQSGGAAPIIFS